MFKNILVPVDGSSLSLKAARIAARLAREQKARLTAFYVAPPYRPYVREETSVTQYESPQQHAARTKAAALKVLRAVERVAAAARVPCKSLFVPGDFPYADIVRTARQRKCDLIVMASHGRRGISRLLLGSETSKVLAHSAIPVLVCR